MQATTKATAFETTTSKMIHNVSSFNDQDDNNNEGSINDTMVKLMAAIPTVLLFVAFTIFITIRNHQEYK